MASSLAHSNPTLCSDPGLFILKLERPCSRLACYALYCLRMACELRVCFS